MPNRQHQWKNKLYYGDNLDVLREHIPDDSVDLVYLDPPFNSSATYNVLFQEQSGEKSAAQITAFEDSWHWGQESEYAYEEVVREGSKKLGDLLQALRSFLGQNDVMAYLTMMAQRLAELHRVLKPTGSIYLHCDPTASHYLKLLMDAIFGPDRFQNEIIWAYEGGGSSGRRFARKHDVLLLYTKSKQGYTFVADAVRVPYKTKNIGPQTYHYEANKKRRPIFLKGFTYVPNPEGKVATDVWADIKKPYGPSRELLGYPTQKPETLLERIIKASSKEGDLVLDPFCGCGTTITVAERLNRRWIGIDITHLAISLMRHRLQDTFGPDLSPYEVIGDPKDLSSASALAQEDRYQFEWWALGLADARPAQDKRKGADTGIDGYINFFDDNSGNSKTVLLQVKSGHVGVSHVRDLKGVLHREGAPIGVLVTLQEPTRAMRKEAAAAGFYTPENFPNLSFPRLQILTVEELLAGKRVQYPSLAPATTFKKAERRGKDTAEAEKRLL